jgi:hypothetical protein
MQEPNAGSVDKYYADQVGGSYPVYAGRYQSGHGLFRTLIRGGGNLIKKGLQNIAKNVYYKGRGSAKDMARKIYSKGKRSALKQARGLARDFGSGRNLKKSFRRRSLNFIKRKKIGNKKGRRCKNGVSSPQAGGRRRSRGRKVKRRKHKSKTIFG